MSHSWHFDEENAQKAGRRRNNNAAVGTSFCLVQKQIRASWFQIIADGYGKDNKTSDTCLPASRFLASNALGTPVNSRSGNWRSRARARGRRREEKI